MEKRHPEFKGEFLKSQQIHSLIGLLRPHFCTYIRRSLQKLWVWEEEARDKSTQRGV